MAFVQIMEVTAPDIAALQQLNTEWETATEGKRTARRQLVTRDRKNPNRYLILVFFDSYESAMQNSNLPETQAFAQRFQQALGGATFHDLDVISDSAL
ncbi:MAG: hypothetical protein JO023_12985 [Chloroflexi bacterium]|nr:hypothetical protein [Chloroflexota bacterium]